MITNLDSLGMSLSKIVEEYADEVSEEVVKTLDHTAD